MGKRYFKTAAGTVPMRDPDTGSTLLVPEKTVDALMKKGWSPNITEATRRKFGIRTLDPSEALDDPVAAVKMGLLRGATLRASDAAVRAVGGEEAAAAVTTMEQENPWAMGGGELGGMALSLAPGGAGALVGKVGGAVRAGVGRVAGEGALAKTGAAVLGTGAEGALFSGMYGVSEVARTKGPIDWEKAVKTVATRGATGLAIGFGLGATFHGLGSLARYGARRAGEFRASTAARLAAKEQGQRQLTEELAALSEVAAPTAQQVMKIHRLQGRLTKATEELNQLRRPMAARMFEEYAKGRASRLAAGVVGAAVGGLPGAAIGTLLGPMATDLAKKAVMPLVAAVERGAARAGGVAAVERVAGRAAAAAPVAGTLATRQATKVMGPKEFASIHQELNAATPESMEMRMFSAMPDNLMQGEDRAAMVSQEVQRVEFLKSVLPVVSIAEAGQTVIPLMKEIDPGVEARTKFSNFVRAAMDPESVLERLRDGDSTLEDWETLRALAPDEYDEIRQVIQSEIRLKLAEGHIFGVDQEAQLSMALGQPSAFSGLGPLLGAGEEEEEEGAGRAPKAPKNLDTQQASNLQALMSRRNKG